MWVALGLTAAVVAAAVLYRADRSNRHMHPALRGLLALLRAAVLAALVMLLARPALRTVSSLLPVPAAFTDTSAVSRYRHCPCIRQGCDRLCENAGCTNYVSGRRVRCKLGSHSRRFDKYRV